MNEPPELEITVRNSKNESATYHAEYTPANGDTPEHALDEVVQGIVPNVASRIKPVASRD